MLWHCSWPSWHAQRYRKLQPNHPKSVEQWPLGSFPLVSQVDNTCSLDQLLYKYIWRHMDNCSTELEVHAPCFRISTCMLACTMHASACVMHAMHAQHALYDDYHRARIARRCMADVWPYAFTRAIDFMHWYSQFHQCTTRLCHACM